MKSININDSQAVGRAVSILKSGGIVLHPTETCYGLAVDVFNEDAVKRLYKVKGMAMDKPTSIAVDGFGMASEYGVFSDKAFDLAGKYWPGALSLIVPRKRDLPNFFNKGNDFVSVRCSSDDFCTKMVKEFGFPVTTTSANLSGEDPLYSIEEGGICELVDLVVDGGEIASNKPSTLVRVDGDMIEVLRQGDVCI